MFQVNLTQCFGGMLFIYTSAPLCGQLDQLWTPGCSIALSQTENKNSPYLLRRCSLLSLSSLLYCVTDAVDHDWTHWQHYSSLTITLYLLRFVWSTSKWLISSTSSSNQFCQLKITVGIIFIMILFSNIERWIRTNRDILHMLKTWLSGERIDYWK